jgi:hypothetical protein
MSASSPTLSSAIEWLKAEIASAAYGRISIGVQVHDGKIAKVFRTVEEVTLSPQDPKARGGDERR